MLSIPLIVKIEMNAFIFLIILFSSTFHLLAAEPSCPVNQCGHGGPKIQFPFQVKGLQLQQHCRPGQPGFEVVCKDNTTLIHFPSYGDLVVRSISYDDKRLNLLDPKNCVHGVFLNLNLSLTPFRYFYGVKKYTYLNCSSALASSFPEVPCLSSSGHHVYTVEPSLALPNSCRKVKTVAIPFQYSPYVSDNSFGLGLSWDDGLPGSDDGEANRRRCGFKSKTGRSSDKGNLCLFTFSVHHSFTDFNYMLLLEYILNGYIY